MPTPNKKAWLSDEKPGFFLWWPLRLFPYHAQVLRLAGGAPEGEQVKARCGLAQRGAELLGQGGPGGRRGGQ